MNTTSGIVIMAVMAILFFIISSWKKKMIRETLEQFKEKANSYTLVIEGCDWGPVIKKIIVNTDSISNFKDNDMSPSMFSVTAEGKHREVTECYFCDLNGNQLENSKENDHIALELSVHPLHSEESPFSWNEKAQLNEWKTEYPYIISHPKFENPITVCNDMFCPQTTAFNDIKTFNRLSACYYAPPTYDDGNKHPLIIWLHGAGEGGNDTELVLLGNKVTALAEDKIQAYFPEGAYVLCVQNPTVWMSHETNYDITKDEVLDKSSQYTEECMHVIKEFVKKHKAIDPSRIYLGGCSNGGYMTINLLLHYQNYFAAAYPICEAYNDKWLSDEDIETLKKTPLWFVASESDKTVIPEEHIIPTTKRLPNAKVSLFKDVHGEDGTEYNGHWSWIYLFNDKCSYTDSSNNKQSLWSWLATQTL
ncbi:MAG: prolyl oligopeptidase family serine peptidase [Treponema sp.]|nr:prolyl oligopeptidase family serine peptidase [Treponema sp.]